MRNSKNIGRSIRRVSFLANKNSKQNAKQNAKRQVRRVRRVRQEKSEYQLKHIYLVVKPAMLIHNEAQKRWRARHSEEHVKEIDKRCYLKRMAKKNKKPESIVDKRLKEWKETEEVTYNSE